jgi:hypothetical protein
MRKMSAFGRAVYESELFALTSGHLPPTLLLPLRVTIESRQPSLCGYTFEAVSEVTDDEIPC